MELDNTQSVGSGDHPKGLNGPDDVILSKHNLPSTLPDSFYPDLVHRILPFCGNEYETSDFHSTVRTLDRELNLKLDETEQRVLALLLTGLAQAHRFDGDVHIAYRLGEDSAVHSCHTAILANEMFRRAGLLEPEVQTAEVTAMRLQITLSGIVHDMGEILGEFNSLPQRMNNPDLAEDPFTEREIYETALRLAFFAVHYDKPEIFYHAIQEMRELAEIAKTDRVDADHLNSIIEKIAPQYDLKNLPKDLEASVQMYLRLFDLAEAKDDAQMSRADIFQGYAVKAIEHLQGTRHLIRFATKDEQYRKVSLFSPHSSGRIREPKPMNGEFEESTVAISLQPSLRILKSASYVESEIGYLFKYAETDAEKKLACTIRDSVYQTMIEYLNAAGRLVDRSASKLEGPLAEAMSDALEPDTSSTVRSERIKSLERLLLAERRMLQGRVREAILGDGFEPTERREHLRNNLMDIESRGRLMSVYLKAIEVGYEPEPGQLLIRLKELPSQLQPLEPGRIAPLRK